MPNIPNPYSELLREPNLLIPGKKPVGAVKVDWTNPITNGLKGCYLLNSTAVANLANGLVTNMPTSEGVIERDETNFAVGSSTGHVTDLDSDTFFPTATMMTSGHVTPGSTEVWATLIEAGIDGSAFKIPLRININALYLYINGTSNPYILFSQTMIDDNPRVISYSWDSDSDDWRIITSNGVNTRNFAFSAPASNYPLKLGARVTWNDLNAEYLTYFYAWNRVITVKEEAEVRRDPYQFLIPA